MSKVKLLANALQYMEENLDHEISTEDVAKNCYCSKSTLEKLFRCMNEMTVHDYLTRRRMMKAAKLLHEAPGLGILEIALTYGYGSNESFTRAFKQVWNCTPSEFRSRQRYSELFPRLLCPVKTGDSYMKRVDISELYDLFLQRKDCWFICCDIANLTRINAISFKAGDIAILETLKRLDSLTDPEDVVFRIGGDEFAILTHSSDPAYAEETAAKIQAQDDQPLIWEDITFPLRLHIGLTKPAVSNIQYQELFTDLHTAIENGRQK